MKCILCGGEACHEHARDTSRQFLRCSQCELVFVPSQQHVSLSEERSRYELHDNSLNNEQYLDYLRSVSAHLDRIPLENPRVLDFGSGPQKALARVMAERGVECVSYDPLFGIGGDALSTTYDIVVVCEVIEHLRALRSEIERIAHTLKPGGYVLVRTEFYDAHTDFESWWYARDITHVNFFRMTTMLHVAELMNKGVLYTDGRAIMLLG